MPALLVEQLDDMLQKFCPNGVQYSEIGTIAEVGTGSSNGNEADENGKYPFFVRSQTVKAKNHYEYDEEAIIIPGEGGIGDIFHYVNGKYALHQRVYRIHFTSPLADVRFAYYYMSANFKAFIMRKAVSATVTSIRKPMIEQFRIPLPPLPVQQEIVHILDSFTALTAELNEKLAAELTARWKQYEHYRDELLTFGDDVPRISLGEVGPVCMCKRILKSQTNDIGGVPFYKIGTFGKEANAYISEDTYKEYRNKYNFPQKGDILISAAGTIGRTVVYDGKPAYFQDSNIVWIANDESKILNRFLIYCYAMKPWYISTGGTIARLYNDNILKARIPAPSLTQQAFIVDTLDRFDRICNDLTSGLPAEIAARQKQYKYFRNKLLTFKELE